MARVGDVGAVRVVGSMLLLSLGLWSCGPGSVGQAARPDAKTAREALGEGACHEVEAEGHPLIVDWPAEARSDLEIAMRSGVPVVHYDCNTLNVIRDCHIEGRYGFVGTSTKETVVRLEDADEIRANLPLSGATIAGGLDRGSTIDVAVVLVGQKATTWRSPLVSDLKGNCAGATHFIRAAHVGAFAMDTGTAGQARAAAEIFGMGASASSSSSKRVQSKDGSLDECKRALPDMPNPPAQCGAPVRLELVALATQPPPLAATPGADASPPPSDDGCPKGMVLSAGKCALKPSGGGYLCNGWDAKECDTQCAAGNYESCYAIGDIVSQGKSGETRDAERAETYFQRGCDGGSQRCCLRTAGYWNTNPHRDPAKSFTIMHATCEAGLGDACVRLSTYFETGTGVAKSDVEATKSLLRACDAGVEQGCFQAAIYTLNGKGTPKDPARAVDLYERACYQSPLSPCDTAAGMLLSGKDVPMDAPRAISIYTRQCSIDTQRCASLGHVYDYGTGVPKDDAKAFELYDRSCKANNPLGCAKRALFQLDGRGTKKDEAAAIDNLKILCAEKSIRGGATACGTLARLMLEGHGVAKQPEQAFAILDPLCPEAGAGHQTACGVLGLAYLNGWSKDRDPVKAVAYLRKGCFRAFGPSNDPEVCGALDSLGGR